MITKINKIKLFGAYRDFTWKTELDDFKEKNIIYGWNYSGKTTFSRLFSCLRDRQLNKPYKESSFSVSFSKENSNVEIDQTNMESFPYEIRVFNSDYIIENLRWEISKEINAISFDVGENVKIREKLNKNLNNIDNLNKRMQRFSNLKKEFEIFDKKITDESRRIKNDIFNSVIEFSKTHFKKHLSTIGTSYKTYIITNKDITELRSLSIAVNNKVKLSDIDLHILYEDLFKEVRAILSEQPRKMEIIDILEDDNEKYMWAKEGLTIHLNNEPNKHCIFCDNLVSEDRISKLNNYFSNAAAQLREKIKIIINRIKIENSKIQNFNINFRANDLVENLHEDYSDIVKEMTIFRDQYIKELDILVDKLHDKLDSNLFNAVHLSNHDENIYNSFYSWKKKLTELINNHNLIINNFDTKQKEARLKLEIHYVASFLNTENYFNKERNYKRIQALEDLLKNKISKILDENNKLESQIKSIAAGKDKLNNFINVFLDRKDIQIDITENNQFILKRNHLVADNLSEGEKTAISFSYFLVSLESMGLENLKQTIVYIDDPISSLDSNHISQIYSLINAFFFRQGIDSNNPDTYVNCFKQLFISTHNFEFFSFLKDSTRLNKKNTRNFYYIKRLENNQSEIQKLPKSLQFHKSEYIYLFDILYRYYSNGCLEQDENLILLPNAIRRFLEIYTLIKLPGSKSEVDQRIKELYSDTNELKTLHHFSHFTSFEKLTRHDEMLMNVPQAANELFELLKKDSIHFQSLLSAVS
jgi:wobble nucleotide-excising tRNase